MVEDFEVSDNEFETGEVGWDRFFSMIVGLIDTTTESIIAEIIDNSIDHNSEEIKVVLGGNDFSNFYVVVYDKGVGFENKEHLRNAFNLAIKYFDKDGRIGKNQVGMKLSPLSNCCTVSVFTKSNTELLHRTIDKKLIAAKGRYGTTEKIPRGEVYRRISNELVENGWTTAVLMTNFDTEPFSGQFSKHIKKFCQQLSDFLGLVYEPLLLGYAKHRCTPKIEIAYENHIYNVLPRDPFWKNFTPDSISSRLELPSSHSLSFKDEDKKLMECIIEYGTIKTISRDVTIDMGEDFSNKKEIIEISSYVIPRNTIRSRIPGIYQRNVIATGPKDTGSGTLRADRMSGFFFYRNGRCICFGDTGARSQFGWYGWKGSIPHKWVRVRFEVKFPESMDEYMKLSPTKDKVNPPNDFFKQIRQQVEQVIYEPLLRGSLGTKSLPFYDQNNEDKSVSGLDADSKYGNIEDCIHCGLFHFDVDKCKLKPCPECKIPGCPPDHCTYQCSLCPNIGHIERNCPTNCKYCEYPNGAGGHNGEPCPLLCDTCGIFNCDGPCNGCNNCICECLCPNCGKKGLPCDCRKTKLQGPVLSQHSMIIEVNKRYKNESILYIKQAMDFLGLQIEDLE